jgi:hypothetical protein
MTINRLGWRVRMLRSQGNRYTGRSWTRVLFSPGLGAPTRNSADGSAALGARAAGRHPQTRPSSLVCTSHFSGYDVAHVCSSSWFPIKQWPDCGPDLPNLSELNLRRKRAWVKSPCPEITPAHSAPVGIIQANVTPL